MKALNNPGAKRRARKALKKRGRRRANVTFLGVTVWGTITLRVTHLGTATIRKVFP